MFIVFEHLDGAGGSLQCELLAQKFRDQGRTVWATAEPTDSEVGKLIRKVQTGAAPLPAEALKYLYVADRIKHVAEINDHLANHEVVICDRYWYSSAAYQDSDPAAIYPSALSLNSAANFLKPDFAFFIDTPIDTCLSRIAERSVKEIFENRQYLEQTFKKYDQLITDGLLIRVDGSGTPEEISAAVSAHVSDLK